MRLFAVILLMVLTCVATANAQPAAISAAGVFSHVKPSLAIIARGKFVGTAFCIASNSHASFYLTNAHVVGTETTVVVFRQFPTFRQMTGTVVASGIQGDPDLAVVRVETPNTPALQLQLQTPREGDPIAVAGYPSAQYNLADISGEIVPSIHQGTISAIENRGGIIEYDALSEHGNSGGPLIDPATGNVIGIVDFKLVGSTEANVGIGIGRIVAPFLKLNNIAYIAARPAGTAIASSETPKDSDSSMLRTLPGAGVVALVYSTVGATGSGASDIQSSVQDFSQKFAAKFGVRVIPVETQYPIDKEKAAALAEQNGALILAEYGPSFRSLGYDALMGTIKWDLSLGVSLVDMYDQSWFGFKAAKTASSARTASSAVVSSLADLNDQVVAGLYANMTASGDGTQVTNLFRYAIPMQNGERRSFYSTKAVPKGAQVTFVPDFSAAGEAGLQLGDIILSVNGVSTVGKTQLELNQILTTAKQSVDQDLLIEAADGTQQHIKFQSRDLRWYVERRTAQSQ